MFDLTKEWPVLVLMGGVVGFFAYVVIKSHQGTPPQDTNRKPKESSAKHADTSSAAQR